MTAFEDQIQQAMSPVNWAWRRLCSKRRLTVEMIKQRGATPLSDAQHVMMNEWLVNCVTILNRGDALTVNDVAQIHTLCNTIKTQLRPQMGQDADALL